MNIEYLEDYLAKEMTEYERLVLRKIEENEFDFQKDQYPPDDRFVSLQKPAAFASYEASNLSNIWAEIPFCGSLILLIPPFPKRIFEKALFKVSEIPKIIDFVKETGRLQVVISPHLLSYEGLDYIDPFFEELNPPMWAGAPLDILGSEKEIQGLINTFLTLAEVRYVDILREHSKVSGYSSRNITSFLEIDCNAYVALKLQHYAIAEEIENLMIDDPLKAMELLPFCQEFICEPACALRAIIKNFTMEEAKTTRLFLPSVYRPQEIRFPCEIGKFLLKKLTYAPQGLRACNHVIDTYSAYDLQRVQESLNEAILENHPDVVDKKTEELSEILDNVWNDKTVPRRIKGLQIGIPLSMAAIGSVAAGPIGATGGFLAGLGYSVADKFIDLGTAGLSERLAKLKTRSYQTNIYDFKKKYKGKIAHP